MQNKYYIANVTIISTTSQAKALCRLDAKSNQGKILKFVVAKSEKILYYLLNGCSINSIYGLKQR